MKTSRRHPCPRDCQDPNHRRSKFFQRYRHTISTGLDGSRTYHCQPWGFCSHHRTCSSIVSSKWRHPHPVVPKRCDSAHNRSSSSCSQLPCLCQNRIGELPAAHRHHNYARKLTTLATMSTRLLPNQICCKGFAAQLRAIAGHFFGKRVLFKGTIKSCSHSTIDRHTINVLIVIFVLV